VFLGIGNIHAMRASHDALMKAVLGRPHADAGDDSFHSRLGATGWLGHVALLVRSALAVALDVRAGARALVHCSDGWDRTSQISALAQLLLDPYYRTREGYRVLVQKEFVAFGHMCKKRLVRARKNNAAALFGSR
jgi:hypothetical protein